MNHPFIYKVLTQSEWLQFQEEQVFRGAPIDLSDGFLHFSTREQLAETIRLHFAGQTGLVVAEVETDSLGDTVKWETSRGGAMFPHVYGELRFEQVHAAWPHDTPDSATYS